MRNVNFRHRRLHAQIGQAGNAMPRYAARHDAGKMVEVRIHIQRHAVKSHPTPDPHAQGRDLVFPRCRAPPRCRPGLRAARL